jgi:hypothetical protein
MPYFRYRLYNADGSEAGEAEYAVNIKPGEIIWTSDGPKLRVLDLVPADSGEYDGLLKVEAA